MNVSNTTLELKTVFVDWIYVISFVIIKGKNLPIREKNLN